MKIAQIGEAILRTPARRVTDEELEHESFHQFLKEMMDTMSAAKGIGIAAPQVFDGRAVMIIASRPNQRYPHAPLMDPTVLINPLVVAQSDEREKDWEGCLSVPGLRGKVSRASWVDVEYQNLMGDVEQQRFKGFVARIFLHEYDHLIGKTWLDHVENTQDIMAEDVWLAKMITSE